MAWFRFYDDVLNKPKIQTLSDELFRTWVNLLCIARLEDAGGILPSDEELAFYMRVTDVSRVTSRVTALIQANLIDEVDGIRQIHNWKKHQFESDKDPSARERKRRQRAKANGNNGIKNVIVTDMSRVTGCDMSRPSDTDTDTDTEQRKEADSLTSPPAQGKQKTTGDGCTRIEKARELWNTIGAGPPCRFPAVNFRAEDRGDCLRTIGAYSDDEIEAAIKTYAAIARSKDHELFAPYRSFPGFMRGGVEKFVPEARPYEAFRKTKPDAKDEETRPQTTKKLKPIPEPGPCECGGYIRADLLQGKGVCKTCGQWWIFFERWKKDESE